MNSFDRRKLRENYVVLVSNLNPEDVMDYLYQENVLSEDDCESIRSATTRAQRMRLFLAILPKRDPRGFAKLLTAMINAGYFELVQLLNGQNSIVESPVETHLFEEDSKLLELREMLEQQSEVVLTIKQEVSQVSGMRP